MRFETLCFTMLAFVAPVAYAEVGIGVSAVSARVYRGTKLDGPSAVPSAWVHVSPIGTLISTSASIQRGNPVLSNASIDTRTGTSLGTWGWVGAVLHGGWERSRTDLLPQEAFEIGTVLSVFRPPYRPSFYVGYDILNHERPIAVVNIPYTLRTAWLPPATFVPELGLRLHKVKKSGVWFPWGNADYLSFAVLMERRWRRFTIVPVITAVIRSGTDVREWIIWGGVHIGVKR
jgi:hypothetical protein